MARLGRVAGIRGLGWDTMPGSLGCARRAGPGRAGWGWGASPGPAGTARDSRPGDGLPLESPLGCGLGQLHPPPAAPRSSNSHPFLGKKVSAELGACCPAPPSLRGRRGQYGAGVPGLRHPAHGCSPPSHHLLRVCGGREGGVAGPLVSPLGSGCQSLRWIWQDSSQLFWFWPPMTSFVRTKFSIVTFCPWCVRVKQTKMRSFPLAWVTWGVGFYIH